jgi:DNA transposition AAA+ family ATPase
MKIEFKQPTAFLETKAHSRFVEFAEACIEHRYIGVCYGRPGVGKTRSAWEFAQWIDDSRYVLNEEIAPELRSRIPDIRAVCITAKVSNTPKTLDSQLSLNLFWYGHARMRLSEAYDPDFMIDNARKAVPLVIVDEADRLSLKSLEHLRHIYDECGMGMILLGMPGMEKRLARYPQLYSRIGFVHEFTPLNDDEIRFLLTRRSTVFGITFNPDIFEHVEAMAIIIRITRGNFRLIERLFAQIKRIMSVNHIAEISGEVVEAARDCLVIGPTD